ncbi:MAG: hypothetical protein JW807_09320 [Spirochaetes bacterium]|nr:hypothetical protein [Spirochaetota bacterium]
MRLRLVLYGTALSALIVSPLELEATTISIGGTAWYAWWDASWAKEQSGTDYTVKPNVLYGPGLSISFPKGVTISSLVLQGKFSAKSSAFIPTGTTSIPLMPVSQNRSTWRLDSDTHLSYAITDYFRILVGFKYTYYEYNLSQWSGILFSRGKIWYNEYAPALGIAFNIHLVQWLYLVIQSSVIFNFSIRTSSQFGVIFNGTNVQPIPLAGDRSDVNRIGSNSSLGFMYHIEPANITILLAGRYQMYKTFSKSQLSELKYMDHFYGATASVMYSFYAKHSREECETDKEK